MQRSGQHPWHGGVLDDFAGVHDRGSLAQVGDHAPVVGDQQDRQTGLVLQVAQQVQDFGLHGDVERGGGFVGDKQLGFTCECGGDRDSLRHAAGQFVRVAGRDAGRVGQVYPFQQLQRPASGGATGQVAVQPEHLPDLAADGEVWVEAGDRFLGDQRNLCAEDRAVAARAQRKQVRAVEQAAPGDHGPAARQQAEDRGGGDGLAAAGLADQAEGFAGLEGEADVGHDCRGSLLAVEADGQVLYRQQRRCGWCLVSGVLSADRGSDHAALCRGDAAAARRCPTAGGVADTVA